MEFHIKQINKTLEVLKKISRKTVMDLSPVYCKNTDYKTDNTLPQIDDTWHVLGQDERFYGRDNHLWFYARFTAPAAEDGKKQYLIIATSHKTPWDATNPQAMLYMNGKPVQGLDVHHTKYLLEGGKEYEMYCYMYTGTEDNEKYEPSFYVRSDSCLEEALYYDIIVPLEAVYCMDKKDGNAAYIITALEKAVCMLDLRDIGSEEYKAGIRNAREYLKTVFYSTLNSSAPTVSCIGHTHIDLAWLWTFRQTREKVQRSFATVLELMKQYPEYKFMSSQAQLYQFLKEESPELYSGVKERIKEGRWEAEGAMWVEADCNLSGGESLVRQLLYGKEFFRDEFGVESKILWLPDVFGYSAALPQILKKSGVDCFVTSKISWNEYNKFPYDAFMWQGIDGTEIYSYLLTCQENKKAEENDRETVYNGIIEPSYVLGSWTRFQQKDMSDHTILTYGYGDGGGGPTMQMLERQRRLAYGLPGIPRTKQETATDFLKQSKSDFEKKSKELNRSCKWVGELYLEKHRGTYTTTAKVKKNNRKSEFLYQNTEKLCMSNKILTGGYYNSDQIKEGWKTILINQFHDVIPGNAIEDVYNDTDIMYKEITDSANSMIDTALDSIISNIGTNGGLLVYNPNGFSTDAAVLYHDEFYECKGIPSCGWKIIKPEAVVHSVSVSENCIENKYYRLCFDCDGNMISLYDKRYDREVVKEGEIFNQTVIYEDYPYAWDAWEISPYYKQKRYPITGKADIKAVHEGARAGLCITRKFLKSHISQYIYLYDNIERIDIETKLNWQERHMLLRAEFPAEINTAKAAFEIQYGMIERDAHSNTSWQQAQFESCAHKWADVSDGGYGVSIINDCKYGHSACGGTIGISLVRGPESPDPVTDLGEHSFTYSILPHKGDFREAQTVLNAYVVNNPMICRETGKNNGTLPETFSLVSCDKENIIIEAVKESENKKEIIIRLYDAYNRKEKVNVTFGFDITSAYLCDLQENHIRELEVCNRSVCFEVSNFEIVTLAVKQ